MKIKINNYSIIKKELLEDIDTLLARLEDFTHGRDGDEITSLRKKLMAKDEVMPLYKIANICVSKGNELAFESINAIKDTQIFLTHEIEI